MLFIVACFVVTAFHNHSQLKMLSYIKTHLYHGQYHHILIEIYQAVNQSATLTSTLSTWMLSLKKMYHTKRGH